MGHGGYYGHHSVFHHDAHFIYGYYGWSYPYYGYYGYYGPLYYYTPNIPVLYDSDNLVRTNDTSQVSTDLTAAAGNSAAETEHETALPLRDDSFIPRPLIESQEAPEALPDKNIE